jgi:hypothetical protein
MSDSNQGRAHRFRQWSLKYAARRAGAGWQRTITRHCHEH